MDPFEAPYWNIVQLIAWVATGDYHLVAIASDHAQREENWVEGRLPDGDKILFKKPPDRRLSLHGVTLWLVHSGIGNSKKVLEEAIKSIIRALASGEIRATGLRRGVRSQIDKSFWKGVAKFREDPLSAQSDLTDEVYSDLRVSPEECLRKWPAFAKLDWSEPAPDHSEAAEEVSAVKSSAGPVPTASVGAPQALSRPDISAGMSLFDSGAAEGEADLSTEEVAGAASSGGQAPTSELGIDPSRSEIGTSAAAATPDAPPTEADSGAPAGPAAVAEIAPDRISISVSSSEVPSNKAIEPIASGSRPEEPGTIASRQEPASAPAATAQGQGPASELAVSAPSTLEPKRTRRRRGTPKKDIARRALVALYGEDPVAWPNVSKAVLQQLNGWAAQQGLPIVKRDTLRRVIRERK
jgi:hypothetical protein